MNDIEALKALLAKVEAGDLPDTGVDRFRAIPKRGGGVYADPNWYDAHGAYWRGSLDAAKTLHEAVLGNPVNVNFSQWANGDYVCTLFGVLHDDAPKWTFAPKFESRSSVQARAWLIAIIKALISEAGQ
jgi:hypothetical protein